MSVTHSLLPSLDGIAATGRHEGSPSGHSGPYHFPHRLGVALPSPAGPGTADSLTPVCPTTAVGLPTRHPEGPRTCRRLIYSHSAVWTDRRRTNNGADCNRSITSRARPLPDPSATTTSIHWPFSYESYHAATHTHFHPLAAGLGCASHPSYSLTDDRHSPNWCASWG